MTEDEGKKHVLLIEDSPTQAQYMRLLLEDAGYQVTFAETGQKGIEIAETAQPDVVLLDVVLPDMDGFNVCHRIRQRSRPGGRRFVSSCGGGGGEAVRPPLHRPRARRDARAEHFRFALVGRERLLAQRDHNEFITHAR